MSLPDGWAEHQDPTTGKSFFANQATGESSWSRPVAPSSSERKASPPKPPPKPKPNPKPKKRSSQIAPKINIGNSTDTEKRRKVLEEILLTEASYNNDIHTVVSVFIEPIQANNVLSRDEFKELFGDWLSLVSLSDMLYGLLQEAVQAGKSMSEVFIKVSPFMKSYAPYLKGYEQSMLTKASLAETSPVFRDFLGSASQDPRCHGLDLGSFLIMPVQRVPRYKLLLDALLHETEKTHPDYQSLTTALAKVSEVAKSNNDLMAKNTNFEALLAVQLKFDSNSKLNLLDIPTRVLIKEGIMEKHSRKGKQARNFWLFNDKLIYGFENVPLSGVFVLSQDIDIKNCVVQDVDDDKDDLSFQIHSQKKSFTVTCKTSEECQDWRQTIEKTFQAVAGKSTEAIKLAPRWVPDAASPACMVCGAAFGMSVRRHHCRACGEAVCSACSSHRKLLPHIDLVKPQRICDPCYGDDGRAGGPTGNLVANSADSVRGIKRFTLKTGTSSMSLSPVGGGAAAKGNATDKGGFGSALLSVALGRKTEAVVIDEVNSDIFLDILAERSPEFASIRNGYQAQALINSVLHPALEARLKANGGLGLVPPTNPPSHRPPPPFGTGTNSAGRTTSPPPPASPNPFAKSSSPSSSKKKLPPPAPMGKKLSSNESPGKKKGPPPPPPKKPGKNTGTSM